MLFVSQLHPFYGTAYPRAGGGVATVETQVGPMMTGKGSGTLFLLTVFVLPTSMRGLTLPYLRKEQCLLSPGRVAVSAVLKSGTVLLLMFVFRPTPPPLAAVPPCPLSLWSHRGDVSNIG